MENNPVEEQEEEKPEEAAEEESPTQAQTQTGPQTQTYPTAAEFFKDDSSSDEAPGISGPGMLDQLLDQPKKNKAPEEDAPPAGLPTQEEQEKQIAANRKTKLHIIIAKRWGEQDIADYLLSMISQVADPDSAKETKNGFKVKLYSGSSVTWGIVQERGQQPYEAIRGERLGFKPEDAKAIVALAAMHGWRQIDVHGKEKHKEMLWMEVQRLNNSARLNFEAMKAAGHIPAEEQFSPPMEINSYMPDANSKVYQQYQLEQAQLEKQLAAIARAKPDPAKTAAAETAPAETAPAETAPDETATAEPEPIEKDTPAVSDGSKFLAPDSAPKGKKSRPAAPASKKNGVSFDTMAHPRGEHGHFAPKEKVTSEFNAVAPESKLLGPKGEPLQPSEQSGAPAKTLLGPKGEPLQPSGGPAPAKKLLGPKGMPLT